MKKFVCPPLVFMVYKPVGRFTEYLPLASVVVWKFLLLSKNPVTLTVTLSAGRMRFVTFLKKKPSLLYVIVPVRLKNVMGLVMGEVIGTSCAETREICAEIGKEKTTTRISDNRNFLGIAVIKADPYQRVKLS